jgi:hypothetical protein
MSNKLHGQFFSTIISNMVFDLHYACLKSYVGLGASAWLFALLVISSFCLALDVLFFMLHIGVD